MTIRAVACDLDGTLLRSDGTIDARTHAALAALPAAGILLVICTARPARWLRPLADAVGHGGVAICANGAVVWDLAADALQRCSLLAPALAAEIVALLSPRLPGGAWAVERVDTFAHEPSYMPRWPVPPLTKVGAIETLLAEPIVKLMVRDGALSADALLSLARGALGDLAELSHSSAADSLLEISAPGVSKASALAALCVERGIEREQVIAFGDMPNDLPMLRWAGRGVAVANGHPEVLAAADEVTAANDGGGVAIVLERLLALAR